MCDRMIQIILIISLNQKCRDVGVHL